MIKYYLLFLTCLFVGRAAQSQNPDSNTSNDPVNAVLERERIASEKRYDDLGALISEIQFEVRTGNKEFEDGIVPWVSLSDPKADIPNLMRKDVIVIKHPSIKIIIDYPLTNQYEFTVSSEGGFTRVQLLEEISKHYYLLFQQEEESATVKTIPLEKRTAMANRNETNGKYGIWGHDIADLSLYSVLVFKTANGEIVLALNILS